MTVTQSIQGNQNVDRYIPRIFENWNQLASRADVRGQVITAEPVIGPSFIINRKKLEDDIISRELQRVRDEFLTEARKIEREKISQIEAGFREKYNGIISAKDGEIAQANRIINIQTALLARIYDSDRDVLLRILRDADISVDDLAILFSETKVED